MEIKKASKIQRWDGSYLWENKRNSQIFNEIFNGMYQLFMIWWDEVKKFFVLFCEVFLFYFSITILWWKLKC